jgi:UDP-N-acetylglucosamine acyltransferase
MMEQIHSTAIIDKRAKIGRDVSIGPYSVIGPDIEIGEKTRILSHVHLEGKTRIGKSCLIYPGAVIGGSGQTKSQKPSDSGILIGNENEIREYVTVHASIKEGGMTVIGDRNLLMANSHVAHDCRIGDDVVMANLATLGGHAQVESQAVIGGLTGVHQFVRIGRLAMVGGVSKLVKDVAPFSVVDGHPAKFYGINAVGMRRAGFDSSTRIAVKRALVRLLKSGENMTDVMEELRQASPLMEVVGVLDFIKASKRGVTCAVEADEPLEGAER